MAFDHQTMTRQSFKAADEAVRLGKITADERTVFAIGWREGHYVGRNFDPIEKARRPVPYVPADGDEAA